MKPTKPHTATHWIGFLITISLALSACAPAPVAAPAPAPATPTAPAATLTPQATATSTAIPPTATPTPPPGFEVDGKPFKFLGAYIPGWYWGMWSKESDIALITSARKAGITVFHLMPPIYEMPIGKVHEEELKHLDHFMEVARQNNLYVMFLFTGGLVLSRQNDLPFSNPDGFAGVVQKPELRQAFKDYMTRVITRVNTVNGMKYSEDPTIMAWMMVEELVSAPFNYPNGFPNLKAAEIADWVQENAAYIKTIDKNHLVTISSTAVMDVYDQMGQDWKPIFSAPALDFVEVEDAEARIRDFPDQMHMFDVLFSLNKPVVVMVAFDSGAVDQTAVCTNYLWQATALRDVVDLYLKRDAAGFTINYWAADTYQAPPYDKCYYYTIKNEKIVAALSDVNAKLGEMNIPPQPLGFVRVAK